MQAPGSDAALSESLMKETAFCDTSLDRMRSGSENRWRNGVICTRMQAWFRVFFGHYLGEMCSNTSSRLGDFAITGPGQSAPPIPSEELYHESGQDQSTNKKR
jgi:hypothetical protein